MIHTLLAKFNTIVINAGHVHLVDLSNHTHSRTITNDAEAVVESVFHEYGNVRITYTDTDGRFDELVHNQGAFTGIKPVTDYIRTLVASDQ